VLGHSVVLVMSRQGDIASRDEPNGWWGVEVSDRMRDVDGRRCSLMVVVGGAYLIGRS